MSGDPQRAPATPDPSAPAPGRWAQTTRMEMPGGGALLIMPSGAQLGRVIRRLRRALRLTIEDLAFAAGVHPTYLSGIERGIRNPTWVKVCGLAIALGVPFSALVRDAEVEAQLDARMRRARAELGIAV